MRKIVISCWLLVVGFLCHAQKLPDMGISRYVFVQSMLVDAYKYDIRDTATACFDEGHWICEVVNGECKRQRRIKYGTFLFNGGDTVGVYGVPEPPHWQFDFCEDHLHWHYIEGIKVLLERWNPTTYRWDFVSFNAKLDYAMANDNFYPGRFIKTPTSTPGVYDYKWNWSILYDPTEYNTVVGPVDSLAWRWETELPPSSGPDPFYIYPTEDYNEHYRGIMPGWGDLYWYVEGNWNHIPDSADGFYRFTAWHKPPFEQKAVWPDTISNIFYLQGDVIISRDTSLPVTCNPSNPDPETISVSGNVVSWDSTGACDFADLEILIWNTKRNGQSEYRVIQTVEITTQTSHVHEGLSERELQRFARSLPWSFNGGKFSYGYKIGNTIYK